MRSSFSISMLAFSAFFSLTSKAQVVSLTESAMVVQPGTDINMGGLLMQPSRELVLENFSLTRAAATPISNVHRSYQVQGTLPSFTGVLNVMYEPAELEGLDPQSLSIMVKEPRNWKSLVSSLHPSMTNTFQSQPLNAVQLSAITLGNESGRGFLKILNNPVVTETLLVSTIDARPLQLFSSDGKLLLKAQLYPGVNKIDLGRYAKGTYVANSGLFSEKVVLR